jgi:hypothetical protein
MQYRIKLKRKEKMKEVEMVLYASINQYATEGWDVRSCIASDWEYLSKKSSRLELARIVVPAPPVEWLAEKGIDYVQEEIQKAKDHMMEQVKILKDMESKFLMIGFDQ